MIPWIHFSARIKVPQWLNLQIIHQSKPHRSKLQYKKACRQKDKNRIKYNRLNNLYLRKLGKRVEVDTFQKKLLVLVQLRTKLSRNKQFMISNKNKLNLGKTKGLSLTKQIALRIILMLKKSQIWSLMCLNSIMRMKKMREKKKVSIWMRIRLKNKLMKNQIFMKAKISYRKLKVQIIFQRLWT